MNYKDTSNNCLYAGTFDPFHYGHLQMIKILSQKYDIVYVFIAKNYLKGKRMYSATQMIDAINLTLKENGILNAFCIDLSHFLPTFVVNKLLKTKDYCRGTKNDHILDKSIRIVNKIFRINTVYNDSKSNLSSTTIKMMFANNEDVSNLVPKPVYDLMIKDLDKNNSKTVNNLSASTELNGREI